MLENDFILEIRYPVSFFFGKVASHTEKWDHLKMLARAYFQMIAHMENPRESTSY